MELSKKLLLALAAAALVFSFASCKEEEDEWNVFNGQSLKSGTPVSIDFTNNSDVDVKYARAWVGTRTNHLSADVQIDIDYNKSTSNGSATAGFIFNLKGEGTETDPYSFCLIGVRRLNDTAQYFASYYTGVLSADISSDNDDFDVNGGENENKAVEYQLTKSDTGSAWVALGSNSYSYDADSKIFTVYIDVATEATTKTENGSYTVTFKKSADDDSTANVTTQTFSATTLASATVSPKTDSSIATTLSEFPVQQEKIAVYAMIGKDRTLKCDYTLSDVERAAIPDGAEPVIIQNADIF